MVIVVASFLLSSTPILGYLSLGDYYHCQLLVEENRILVVNDPQWAKTHHNRGMIQVGRIDDVVNGVLLLLWRNMMLLLLLSLLSFFLLGMTGQTGHPCLPNALFRPTDTIMTPSRAINLSPKR